MTKRDVKQGIEEEAGEYVVEQPIPLDDPILPQFPENVLPTWLTDMVEAVAKQTETPMELPAMMGLGAVSTAVHGRFVIESEPQHFEGTNVWACAALESGNRKTPVLKQMTRPIVEWEMGRADSMALDIQEKTSNRRTGEKHIEHLRNKAAKEDDPVKRKEQQDRLLEIERNLPEVPKPPRLWAEDITPERLGEIMADAGGSLAILSDEGGVFDLMGGRYSNGVPNLDIYLKSHSNAPLRVDRRSRPTIFLPRPALTLALSPQPDVLRSLADKPGFRGRGLLARIFFVLPRSTLGYRSLESRKIPEDIRNRYKEELFALLNISHSPGEEVFILKFSRSAKEE